MAAGQVGGVPRAQGPFGVLVEVDADKVLGNNVNVFVGVAIVHLRIMFIWRVLASIFSLELFYIFVFIMIFIMEVVRLFVVKQFHQSYFDKNWRFDIDFFEILTFFSATKGNH